MKPIRGAILLVFAVTVTACGSAPPPPEAAPAAITEAPPEPSELAEGKGQVGRHAYTYLRGPEGTVFFFTPTIPNDDEALMTAMRHVLTTDFGVEGRLTSRVAGPSLRFIAGSGIYDVTPVREREGGPVTGLVVQRR